MGRVRAARRSPSWRIGFAATEAEAGADALHPREQALVEGASTARQLEFATGRHCARLALSALSKELAGVPVLADARGAPLWPAGFVGSITHCTGWTGAVVARSSPGSVLGRVLGRGVRAVGLDAEPIAPLPPGVLDVVASGDERDALARLGAQAPGIPWDTLLFSAKEATYKAWFPLTGLLLPHQGVGVDLSADGSFRGVAAARDGHGTEVVHRVRGRWALGSRVAIALGVVG